MTNIVLFLLCAHESIFALGLRIANDCDQQGRWIMSGNGSSDRVDTNCKVPPKFDVHKFCTEQLQCSSMLIVGDSTMQQKFFVLATEMEQTSSLELSVQFDFPFSIYEDFTLYNPRPRKAGDYNVSCNLATSVKHKSRTIRSMYSSQICQKSCAPKVDLTFIRHDHLNGLKYGDLDIVQCDNWKNEVSKYAHLMIGTGTHVGDHPDLLKNKDNVWESRAKDLFQFLSGTRPKGIIWTPAYYGVVGNTAKCPDPHLWKDRPQSASEINTDLFGGSWARISEINKMYKNAVKQFLPEALILDHEDALSMRVDCRRDPIHFASGPASPLHWQIRHLQYLMTATHYGSSHTRGSQ